MNIYTGIDLGTDSIKFVVAYKDKNSFRVLSSTHVRSEGIKRGRIVDSQKVSEQLNAARKIVEEELGMHISKALVCISSRNAKFDIVDGSIDVMNPESITGIDVKNVLKDSVIGKVFKDEELISSIPIGFEIDNKDMVKDPKGLASKTLKVRSVISTVLKDELIEIKNIFNNMNIEIVGFSFNSIFDYFAIKDEKLDKSSGIVINIGEDTTTVSVVNKGITIKNSIINVGSKYVDHDLSYIYHIDRETARGLKENFVVALSSIADVNDLEDIKTEADQIKTINQEEASKIVEARVRDILKFSNEEIKKLTNREISYIIVVGGLSEMTGFGSVVEEVLGPKASVYEMTNLGIRSNIYTGAYGIIKHFDYQEELIGSSSSFMTQEEQNLLVSSSINESKNKVGKVFGKLFD